VLGCIDKGKSEQFAGSASLIMHQRCRNIGFNNSNCIGRKCGGGYQFAEKNVLFNIKLSCSENKMRKKNVVCRRSVKEIRVKQNVKKR